MKRAAFAGVLIAMTLSCEAVPDLQFAPSDADVDVRPRDAEVDVRPRDAGGGDTARPRDGASEAEAEPAGGCPSTPPDGGVCCGDIPCLGKYCEAGCASCVGTCGMAKVCCARNAMHVSCHSAEAGCP